MSLLDLIKQLLGSNKKNVQIISQDMTKIYKDPEVLEVGLYSDNEPLKNKNIIIEIDDVKKEKLTNKNGIAKMNINLGVGKYRAFFIFEGDNEYKKSKEYVDIIINPKIETNDFAMIVGDGGQFTATLKDYNNDVIPNTEVIFNINGKTYTRTTNDNGQASLNINLPKGQYNIKTISGKVYTENIIVINEKQEIAPESSILYEEPVLEQTSELTISEGTITPSSSNINANHFGYWIFGRDMNNVNLDDLKNHKVTDVFLNYYTFTANGDDQTKAWIKQAKDRGIAVHIWMQVFYDGEWHNPVGMDLSARINEAKGYAAIDGVAGVHLDYFRYPGNAYKSEGGAEAITNFARQMREAIPNVILSCAVMPESDDKYYYGQDIDALGKIMDVIIPMQYTGNYGAGESWLASTSQLFSSKATVWAGLQSYKSDDDATPLSEEQLQKDIRTCLTNGTKGAILFRYGLSPNVNFPLVLPGEPLHTRMEGTEVNMSYQDGTQYQCAVYDESNRRVYAEVSLTINGKTYIKQADNEGLYKLNLNLSPGTYTIQAVFTGNEEYIGSSVQNTIIIKPASQITTRMEGTNVNMEYQDGTPYQCAIYDVNNQRVFDKVVININGKDYTREADGEGLYKLNLNLPIGSYKVRATFYGNDKYKPSSVENDVIINEKREEPVELYDYFTNQGGGYLGQKTGYSCACHALVQCFHRLTGEDVSEETLMSVCGTTEAGTDHDGINTGVSWFNRTYGYDIKIEWMNFSDLGNNIDERFAKVQDMINNGAMFFHLLYRDQWGHYEVPQATLDDPLIILNSLGDYCNYPSYCGWIESRSRSEQISYINGISQKSVAYLHH